MAAMKKNIQVVLGLGFAMQLVSTANAAKITVMSYNVENLFDTTHDEGKTDFTYLPKRVKQQMPEAQAYCRAETNRFYREECYNIDWTQEKLNKKLASLTRVVASVNSGRGPDVMALQEVENINVLNQWMKLSLSKMGYKEVVLIEGPDPRGIDVAVVSKFPLAAEAIYHDANQRLNWEESTSAVFSNNPLQASAKKLLRGILEATFSVGGGQQLTIMSNHWPSQKPGNSSERVQLAKVLQSAAQDVAASGRPLVSMGDYNTLDSDKPHGINEWILNKRKPVYFFDARAQYGEYLKEAGSQSDILPGSHWYKGEYTALDKIFVLQATAAQLDVDWSSFKVINRDFMMTRADIGSYDMKPKRFDFDTAEGISDHLPITLDLSL